MLEVRGLQAWYGSSHVLRGLDLVVRAGEIVNVLGRNGSGRSTLAKAVMGLVHWQGLMAWNGRSLAGRRVFEVAQLGVGYLPESRDVFPRLTVHQNLMLGLRPGTPAPGFDEAWTADRLYAAFPLLHKRRNTAAGVLSGGEQQVLSLGRTLMGNPRLLIADEPLEGLAPAVAEQVGGILEALRAQGTAVLLVDQNLGAAGGAAPDRVLVLGHGRAVFEGSPAQLLADTAVRREWLEV